MSTSDGKDLPVRRRARPLAPRAARGRVVEPMVPLPEFTSPLTFGNLCRGLRHRWLLGLTVALVLCSASGAGAWYLVPAKYTAYCLLRVAAADPHLLPDS